MDLHVNSVDQNKVWKALLEDVSKKHISKKPVDKTRYSPCDRYGAGDFVFFKQSGLNN